MLSTGRRYDRCSAALRRSEAAVGQASDQPGGDGYIYALTDEAAYLQTDEDEKPPITAEPPPDPAWFKCWFCRKSHPQVQRLYGAEYPVRDPNIFAVIHGRDRATGHVGRGHARPGAVGAPPRVPAGEAPGFGRPVLEEDWARIREVR